MITFTMSRLININSTNANRNTTSQQHTNHQPQWPPTFKHTMHHQSKSNITLLKTTKETQHPHPDKMSKTQRHQTATTICRPSQHTSQNNRWKLKTPTIKSHFKNP